MSYYAGGRDIFRATNTDNPPPGAYDVNSPEARYKKYGFLSHSERFKEEREPDEHQRYDGAPPSLARSNSRSSASERPVGKTAMTMVRAEEARLKREIEACQRSLQEQQVEGAREARKIGEKVRLAEDRIKELLRERSDLKQRLLKRESELRAKDKERDLLAEQLDKQTVVANPRSEKALKEHAEAANGMCVKLKATLEQMRRVSEEDKRRLRAHEARIRKLEQEKDAAEGEVRQLDEYPRQLAQAEKELRAKEEGFREDVRKLKVAAQEASDRAARYMAELGESAVHNTALENELQLAREKQAENARSSNRQVDAARAQLEATQARLADLERLSRQRSEEADRTVRAAHEHVDELKAEIARLEDERSAVQREVQGTIRQLKTDYLEAKREFESTVKDADDDRVRRLADAQARADRANAESLDLKREISELRGILLKKEMAWKDRRLELEGDLQAAASDFAALQQRLAESHDQFKMHVAGLEDRAKARELAWTQERTGLAEKLDAAHKDSFRLRDALDKLTKSEAQARADAEADVARMAAELEDAREDSAKARGRWDDERRETARTHAAELAALREDLAEADRARDDLEATHAEELAERDARLAEYEDALDSVEELHADNAALREEIAALRESSEDSVGDVQEALAHYAELLRGVGEARRADRELWRDERARLVDQVRGLELKLGYVEISRDHLARVLGITDDARKHMVGEARAMYMELEDAADVVYGRMDVADELAADLQRALTIEDDGDVDCVPLVDETAVFVRRAFVDDVLRTVDARVASAQAAADVSELRLMRVQGHVVEAVADISSKHKLKVAELHGALDQAKAECRQVHELAAEDRKFHDARVAELELALANAPTSQVDSEALAAAAVAPLHAHIDALTLQLRGLEDAMDDSEARAEEADRRARAYEMQASRSRAILDQSEVNMAEHVDTIGSLRQHIAEVECERAIMAEEKDFQITWLKDNYAQAYRGLESVLSGGGGHTNLNQRIRYVNGLKAQILALKKEVVECARDRDRHGHHVRLLKSELDAYKEINEDDAVTLRKLQNPAARLTARSRRRAVPGSESGDDR
ncbi:hypothetical protein IWW39_001358 [Coemansia spiralis]|uniref:Hyaluronan-mediated motility receptor C-terminal domain-containing protein n=1 Tax=Coemansia spiralis TaxID=417178 RepID=A0A9W8GQB4_9FUNG|nr:hypothetical protein IWW39_001358 [Coemansia spiralis]